MGEGCRSASVRETDRGPGAARVRAMPGGGEGGAAGADESYWSHSATGASELTAATQSLNTTHSQIVATDTLLLNIHYSHHLLIYAL